MKGVATSALALLCAVLVFVPPAAAADTSPPTISLTRPIPGETISGWVRLKVNVADNVGVTRVDYYLDGTWIAYDNTPTDFSEPWYSPNAPDGPHTMVAKARDAAGNVGTSAPVSFYTKNGTPGDTSPPTVAVTSPASGAVVSGTTTLNVNASDNVGVTRVDYYVDGAAVAFDDTPTDFSEPWNTTTVADGSHTIVAKARDAAGNVGTSATVSFSVSNGGGGDTSPPVVSVVSPTAGAVVSGTTTLNVHASDNVGVTRVDYYVDGAAVAFDDTPTDFSTSWDSTTVADGSHTIVAKARDAAGNVGTSASVSFTVSNGGGGGGDTSPPTVTIVSPSNGAVVSGGTTLDVLASDNVGVTRVDYYLDGAIIASDTSGPPWDVVWDSSTVADGSHTLVARASDAAGNAGDSPPVSFTVDNVPSGSCPRPYLDTSPWNTPISSTPAIHTNSSYYVSSMTPTLTSDPTQYTYPVFYATSSTPVQSVSISGVFSNVTAPTTLQKQSGGSVNLPVPDGVTAAAGTDGQVIILNSATGDEWGFWRFGKDSTGHYFATNGYHYNTNWSGVPPSGFGSRGAGVPYLAGLVRPCEIAQGHIDHALAFAYDYPTSQFIYPATKSDGRGTLGNDMPEGARLQLDPSLTAQQLESMGITGPALIIAQALQRYGMYIIDNSGHEKLIIEYEGTAHWGGAITASTAANIPLSKFRWVDGG